MTSKTKLLLAIIPAGLILSLLVTLFLPRHITKPPTIPLGRPTSAAGCYYQEVQCIRAPCPPILICPSPSPTTSSCKVAGCSGELCVAADSPDVASICIYRADFACYKLTSCALQPNGNCGWTPNPKFTSCLQTPPPLQ